MANTITNFLVGVGFDYDEKSAEKIGTGIDGVKSKALQLGAVVAGAFGIKSLAGDFAQATDTLGKFSQVFGVSADDVSSFGRALEIEGGTLESFMSQLEGLERLRAGTKQGEFGFVAAAQLAGVDTEPFIKATNATEAYLALADQFKNLSGQQRINAAAAFGLDDASIRLLSKGRDGVSKLVEQQRKMRPVTDSMIESSAEFNDQMLNLSTNVGGFADKISERLLPEINNVVSGLNDWITANRELANSTIDSALNFAIDNPNAVAAGTGLATAATLSTSAGLLGKTPLVGKALAGSARFGAAGLAVGSAGLLGIAIGEEINEHLSATTKDVIGRSITEVLAFFGNDEAQRAIAINERSTSPSQQPGNQQINLTVEVGGETIDKRIMKVNERQNQITLNDLTSVSGG